MATTTAYILLGSNLGNRTAYLQAAINEIEKQCGPIIITSSIYETEAWGVEQQPPYLNQVIAITTTLLPEQLMQTLLEIELKLGRKRTKRFAERTIDLDILLINNLIFQTPLRKQQGKKLLIAVGMFGLCIIVFAISKVFWISFVVLLISGIVDGVSVVVRGTIMQLKTPDHMRGRVLSVSSMFVNSSNELGQFESGMAAKLMGVVPSVVFGGCMTLLVVGVTWIKSPVLRKMEY